MDRLLNIAFYFILIVIFVLLAPAETQFLIMLGFLLALPVAYGAFFMDWLTLDGARSALLAGACMFGLGGYNMAFLVLLFFISSSLLGSLPVRRDDGGRRAAPAVRRTGIQVWANSFWVVISLILLYITGSTAFLIAALAALASATADTWATEMGSERFRFPTRSLLDFKPVPPGTEGGVSVPGTAASLCGSALIAGVGTAIFSLNLNLFFIIFLAGFSGSLFDSFLGTVFGGGEKRPMPFVRNDNRYSGAAVNSAINWASAGFATITALIINGIFV